ncbi:MAG: 23S rRNA (pseudouridine(1915)-N(3))-methyltransferase RlmH [Gammaproteobacteria bacterium]
MQLEIISMHSKLPAWIQSGLSEYLNRIPNHFCQINFKTLSLQKTESDFLKLVSPQSLMIILDSRGKNWSTLELKKNFESWQQRAPKISLLIGGPNGFSEDFLKQGQEIWSLSNLIFPHALVQIMLLEQLYRVYSMIHNHPYHRA